MPSEMIPPAASLPGKRGLSIKERKLVVAGSGEGESSVAILS